MSELRLPCVRSDLDSGEVGEGKGVKARPGRGCTPRATSIGDGGLLVRIIIGEAGLLSRVSLNNE